MRASSSYKQPRVLVSSAKELKYPEYVDSRTVLERVTARQSREPLAFNSNLDKFRTPSSKKVNQNRVLNSATKVVSPIPKSESPVNEYKNFNSVLSSSQKELQITRNTLIEQQGKYEKLVKDQKFHINDLEMENLKLTKENLSLRSGLRKDLDSLQDKDNKLILELQKKLRDFEDQNKYYLQENLKLKQNYEKEILHLRTLLKETDNKVEIYKREFNNVHGKSQKNINELGFKEEFIRKLQDSIKDKTKIIFDLKQSNDQYLKFLEEKENKILELEKDCKKEKQMNRMLSDRIGIITAEYSPDRKVEGIKGRFTDQKGKNSKFLQVEQDSHDFEGSLEKSLKKARISMITPSGEDALVRLKHQILDLESKISDLTGENLQFKRENYNLAEKNKSLDEDVRSYRSFIARSKGKDAINKGTLEQDDGKREIEGKTALVLREKEKFERLLKESEASNKLLKEKFESADRRLTRIGVLLKSFKGIGEVREDFEDALQSLKEKIEKLEDECEVLREQVPGLLEENNTMYLDLKTATEKMRQQDSIIKDYNSLKDIKNLGSEIRSILGITEKSELNAQDYSELKSELLNLIKKSEENEKLIKDLYSLVQQNKKLVDSNDLLEHQVLNLNSKIEKKILKIEGLKLESQSQERKLKRAEESMQFRIEEIKAEANESMIQLEQKYQNMLEEIKIDLAQSKVEAEDKLKKQFELDSQQLGIELSQSKLWAQSLEVEINEKNQEIAFLVAQAKDCNKEIEDSKVETSKKNEQISILEEKIKAGRVEAELNVGVNRENENLQNEIRRKKEKKVKLQEELIISEKQNKIYEETMSAITEKLKIAESEREKLKSKSNILEKDLNSLEQETNYLKEQLHSMQSLSEPSILLEDSQENIKKAFEDRENELLNTISGLNQELTEVNQEKIELNLQFCSINTSDLSVIKKKIEELKLEKTELGILLNQKVADWQTREENLKTESKKIEENLAKEIFALGQKLQSLLEDQKKEQEKVNELENELAKNSEESKQKDQINTDLSQKLQELENLKPKLDQLKGENLDLLNLANSLKNANHNLSIEMAKLETTFQIEKNKLASEFSAQVENLTYQLSSAKGENEKLLNANETLLLAQQKTESKLKEINTEHKAEIEDLQQQHAKELLCIQTLGEEQIEIFINPGNLNSIEALQTNLQGTKVLLEQIVAEKDFLSKQISEIMNKNQEILTEKYELIEQNSKLTSEFHQLLQKLKNLEQENLDLNKLVDDENMISIEESLVGNDSVRLELETKELEIKNLKENLEAQGQELKNLKENLEAQSQELKNLKKVLAEKIEECEQNLELRKNLSKVSLDVKDKESKIKLLEMQKKKLTTENQDLQEDLKNLREEFFVIVRNNEDFEKKLEKVEGERDLVSRKSEDLSNEVRMMDKMKEKSEFFEGSYAKVKEELEVSQKICDEKIGDIEKLTSTNSKLQEDLAKLSEYPEKLDEVKEKVEKLSAELKQKEAKLKIVESEQKKILSEKKDLQDHLKALQEENYDLIRNLEKLEDEQKVDELLDVIKLEKSEPSLKTEKFEEKVEGERDLVSRKSEDLSDEMRKMDKVKEKSEFFERCYAKVKEELEVSQKICDEKVGEIEKLTSTNSKLQEDLAKLSEFPEKLDEVKEKVEKLSAELKQREAKLKIVETEQKKILSEKKDLQDHLKALQEENYDLIRSLEKLEDEQKVDELLKVINKLEKSESNFKTEIFAEKQKISELLKEKEATSETLKALEKQIADSTWKEEKNRLQEELKVAEGKIIELEEDVLGLEGKMRDFEVFLNEKNDKIRELEENIEKVESKFTAGSGPLAQSPDSQDKTQDFSAKCEELGKQVKAKDFQLKIIKAQKQKIEEELASSHLYAK